MKKSLLLLILALLFVSCADISDVAEFEADQQSADAVAKNIANYLADFAEIEDCSVEINGKTAVISLDLARKFNDAELIALKRRIVADVKSQNAAITHVAVNTAPDMIEYIRGRGNDAPAVEKALEENRDEEIFVNIAPTA